MENPKVQPPSSAKRSLKQRFEFQWEVLDVIVGGKSTLDSVQGFKVRTREEATRFALSYGFDLEDPISQAELFGNFHEALSFIKRYFLAPENPDGLKIEVPRRVVEVPDVRDLLLMANYSLPNQREDSQGTYLRNWACAILKVIHTIAHIDQDLRASYFGDIQKQIFDRYYRLIHRDGEGRLYLGEKDDDPDRVDLVAFQTKPKKTRDSTLIKLLHKPENVAEDIFDRVGIRFVTESRLGVLQVVKYLKDKMVIMPPNIKPSRSRNNLIALDPFRTQLPDLLERGERGELSEERLMQELEESLASASAGVENNPHSSQYYRSVQFTGRQLIRLRNPLYDDLKELKAVAKNQALEPGSDVARAIERVDLKYLQREVRFFYPYEVQLVDQRSHEENEKGRSAHREYKRAQLLTAMKRVMGPLAVSTS